MITGVFFITSQRLIINVSIVKTYPTVTSKMLEPTDDDTAMSPLPCFATKTLVIKSGTDVPAAKNVKPMTYVKRNIRNQYPFTSNLHYSIML